MTQTSNLKPGDRILLHAIELDIDEDGDAAFAENGPYIGDYWLTENPDKWTRVIVEPVNGSIVVDKQGDGWQRSHEDDGERSWRFGDEYVTYENLLRLYGPLRPVYTPAT
jgi:hypothetical protein